MVELRRKCLPVVIPRDEANLIGTLLRMPDSELRKGALQRLCQLYEAGSVLLESYSICQTLNALLGDEVVEVRRWAFKAVALLNNPKVNLKFLIEAIERGDSNYENQTWAIAALFAIADEGQINKLIEEQTISVNGAAMLAANLYPRRKMEILKARMPIDINKADPLTLKWACLLFGYDKANDKLFDPKFDNEIVVPSLNSHDNATVSEYSVWSLWRNPNRSLEDLGFDLQEISSRPSNVRRWAHRLIAKDINSLNQNIDILEDIARDNDPKAREGLALGIVPLYDDEMARRIVSWQSNETETSVRRPLLEHMATFSDECNDYKDIVIEELKRWSPDDVYWRLIKSAAQGKSIYSEMRRMEYADEPTQDLFKEPPSKFITVNGDLTMNTQKFDSGGGDINLGNNVGSGNLYISADQAIGNMQGAADGLQDHLKQLLALIRAEQQSFPNTDEVLAASEECAEQKSKISTSKLIDALTNTTKLVDAGSKLYSALQPIIAGLKGLIS